MSTQTKSKPRKASRSTGPKVDRFAEMTAKFVKLIEDGVADPTGWKMPWQRLGGIAPVNVESKARYQGVNHLYLWCVAAEAEKPGIFGTYNQWNARHCQVRKGEHGHLVVRWITMMKKDAEGKPKIGPDGRPETFMVPKVFTVFGIWQVDNTEGHDEAVAKSFRRFGFAPDGTPDTFVPMTEVIEGAEAFFAQVGADVTYGGDVAGYIPSQDRIVMPNATQFKDAVSFNATLGHEHIHWTGHTSRLKRDGIITHGDRETYAFEELVAEIGAAFLGQRLGYATEPRDDHRDYLAGWLRRLKDDPKALWKAARLAENAVTHLCDLAGLVDAPTEDDDEEVNNEEDMVAA